MIDQWSSWIIGISRPIALCFGTFNCRSGFDLSRQCMPCVYLLFSPITNSPTRGLTFFPNYQFPLLYNDARRSRRSRVSRGRWSHLQRPVKYRATDIGGQLHDVGLPVITEDVGRMAQYHGPLWHSELTWHADMMFVLVFYERDK